MTEQRQPAGDDGGLPPAFNPPSGRVDRRSARRRGGASGGWGTAVFGAAAIAVAGTGLHSQILYAGGTGYPWGAVAAVVFAAAVMVWAGLKTGKVPTAGLAGVLAYVLVGLMALAPGGEPLIITGTTASVELQIAVAGRIWMIGLALAAVASVVICAWALKPLKGTTTETSRVPATE